MSTYTTNSIITIHDDADETHCALCGRYSANMRQSVVFDGCGAVQRNSDDYDADLCDVASVCSTCEDKFARGILQEI